MAQFYSLEDPPGRRPKYLSLFVKIYKKADQELGEIDVKVVCKRRSCSHSMAASLKQMIFIEFPYDLKIREVSLSRKKNAGSQK